MAGENAQFFGSGINLLGSSAYNMRLQNITGVGDFSAAVDGVVGFHSSLKRLCFVDTASTPTLVAVPRVDIPETVSGLWTFNRGNGEPGFAIGSNALGVMIAGLNAEKVGGKSPHASAVADTLALRDGSGRMKAASPAANDDVATKGYTDDAVQGLLEPQAACQVASTTNVDIASAPGTLDGVTLLTDYRVLLLGQTTPAQNGVYVFNGAGSAMTRATDADSSGEILQGMNYFVQMGTTYGGSRWQLISDTPLTLGTDALEFVQIGGSNPIQSGAGLDMDGNVLFVKLGSAGAPAGSQYTQGGIVWCDTTSTLNMSAALTGIVKGNGTGAPTAVTGTADRLAKWGSGGATLADSVIRDDGSKIGVGGVVETGILARVYGRTRISGGSQILDLVGDQDGTTATNAFIAFLSSGMTRSAYIGPASGSSHHFYVFNEKAGNIVFGTNSTTRWTITSAGVFEASGNGLIQASSGSLTFATGTGNNIILSAGVGASSVQAIATSMLLTRGTKSLVFNANFSALDTHAVIATGTFSAQTTMDLRLQAGNDDSSTGLTVKSNGNIGFNTSTFGTSAAKVLAIGAGTAPTTGPNDIIQMWVEDRDGIAARATLHIRAESTSLIKLGGDGFIQAQDGVADATGKSSRWAVGHYTNAEEPFVWAVASSGATHNSLAIGGGTSVGNAATYIEFMIAPDRTTTTGTREWVITQGILEANGAKTIRTSTGSLTLATAAGGSGDLIFSTNGTERWKILYDTGTLIGSGAKTIQTSSGNLTLLAGGASSHLIFSHEVAGNFGFGTTSFGTSANRVISIANGTAPTTSPADLVQLWSADRAAASGKAGLHIRSEDGTSHVFSDRVGLGILDPQAALDVVGLSGAFLCSSSSSDATNKSARWGVRHYFSSEEPFYFLVGDTTAGANAIYIGGGSSGGNAATSIRFYTAGDTITPTGTTRMMIDSEGFIGINTTSPTAHLQLNPGTDRVGASGIGRGWLFVNSGTYTNNTTVASGTTSFFAFNTFRTPTLAASNTSVTTSDAAAFYIEDAPAAGTNMTLTRPWALWVAAGNTRLGGSLFFGTDTVLYRGAADILKTEDKIEVQRGLTTDLSFSTYLSGDAHARCALFADGKMVWGSGSAAVDTTLARSGAGVLTLTGNMIVTGLSASLPLGTNGSKQLVSITDLAGSLTIAGKGIARGHAETLSASLTTYTITHNMGTRRLGLFLRNTSTNIYGTTGFKATSDNAIELYFDVAPAGGLYEVILFALP